MELIKDKAISSLAFGVAFIIIISVVILNRNSDIDFEENLWKDEYSTGSSFIHISKRQRMLKDLVQNNLHNKTKNEIISLLGQPIPVIHFHKLNPDMIYKLGNERKENQSFGKEWLLIWLNNEQRYNKYQIATK